MKTLSQCVSLIVLGLLVAPPAAWAYSHPGGLYTSAQYDFVATKVQANAQPWKAAYDKLIVDANAWLAETPSAVATWTVPNAYSDPAGHTAARTLMMNDAKAAYACALAYRFTGTAAYANKTRDLINQWASVNTSIAGGDGPLVTAYAAVGLILSAELIKGYSGWAAADKAQFVSWVNAVFIPKVLSIAQTNNWGDWKNFALLAAYHYTDDTADFTTTVSAVKNQIDTSLHVTGYLPDETTRAENSLWYHYFALAPLTAAAQFVYNTTGEDLFNWTSGSGKRLRTAVDYLFYYSQNPGAWPWHANPNFPNPLGSTSWPLNLFEAMGGVYGNASYTAFVQGYRTITGPFNSGNYHHFAWFYPTLMRDVLQLGTGGAVWNLFEDEMDNYAAGWGTAGSPGSVTQGAGFVTVVDSSSTNGNYFFLTRSGFTPPAPPFTLEVRGKARTAGTTNEITVRSGSYGVSLFITHGTAGLAKNREGSPTKSFTLNTTIAHLYRLVVHANATYDLYVDGALAWSGSTGTATGSNILKIGGSATTGVTANFDVDAVRLGSGTILP